MDEGLGKCNVCSERDAIGVAAIPGIPMSVAWCRECIQSGAIPYWAAVANTAIINGMEYAAEWWHEVVDDTLRWLGKSREEFDADVAVSMEDDFRRMEEENRERSAGS